MRYTLFGQAEGVLAQSTQPLWAVAHDDVVLDASITARSQGIRVGMSEKSAKALVPQMSIYPLNQQSDNGMPKIRDIIQRYTPWVEFVDQQQFYAQIPAVPGASKEVREILLSIHQILTSEQRIRIGLAECKQAARALVEWSRYGTIPGAGLFVVGQQQLIVSPNIIQAAKVNRVDQQDATTASASVDTASTVATAATSHWLHPFPIAAMWVLPPSVREQLAALGVHTFGEFIKLPTQELKAWFEKEIWLYKELFRLDEMIPAFSGMSNSIPEEYRQTWRADIGESADSTEVVALARTLLKQAVLQLTKHGLGTQRIQLEWETDVESNQFFRLLRSPMCTIDTLWSQLLPGLQQLRGNHIYSLQFRIQSLCHLQGQQLSFTVVNNRILPTQQKSVDKLNDVLSHVNQKFPRKLKRGIKAGFRELRMEAIGEL